MSNKMKEREKEREKAGEGNANQRFISEDFLYPST